jgi:hypothetical protein
MTYSTKVLPAAVFLALACGGGSCDLQQDCFDPDDPCPNDMVSDESGCVWDRCSGEFTGNLLPCSFFLDFEHGVIGTSLAGEDAELLAFVERKFEHPAYGFLTGPIWLYDIEHDQKSLLTEEDRACFDLQVDGTRIGWQEVPETGIGDEHSPAANIHVMDIMSGEHWLVEDPEIGVNKDFRLAGDDLVFTVSHWIQCDVSFEFSEELYHYDLRTREKKLLEGAIYGEYGISVATVKGGRVVYGRFAGQSCGPSADVSYRLRDLDSGEDYELVSFPGSRIFFFDFDGRWFVYSTIATIEAIDVDTLEHVEVTRCGHGDCIFRLEQGRLLYDRHGEDGLDQYQLYVKEVDSEQRTKITDLRPYYDNGVPRDFESGRLLWKESRGRTIYDECGGMRSDEGVTWLVFWKDLP